MTGIPNRGLILSGDDYSGGILGNLLITKLFLLCRSFSPWDGGGDSRPMYDFSKMTILFQQNHYFITFLFVRIWGERGYTKRVRLCRLVKIMKECATP